MKSLHDYSARLLDGTEVPLSQYKGRVVLVVNTASNCGLAPQLQGLQQLQDRYASRGLVILGFPSGDFKGQELGSATEIGQFCQRNYGVTFPMFQKGHVRGRQAQPVFSFLSHRRLNGHLGLRPLWNFQKYLIDPQGRLVNIFLPIEKPTSRRLIKSIEKHLPQNV